MGLNNKEQFGKELFYRNHNCNFIKALNDSQLSDEIKENIKKQVFEINQENGGGIGIITRITCLACNFTEDITDYDCW